jgi:hypothetical protein
MTEREKSERYCEVLAWFQEQCEANNRGFKVEVVSALQHWASRGWDEDQPSPEVHRKRKTKSQTVKKADDSEPSAA